MVLFFILFYFYKNNQHKTYLFWNGDLHSTHRLFELCKTTKVQPIFLFKNKSEIKFINILMSKIQNKYEWSNNILPIKFVKCRNNCWTKIIKISKKYKTFMETGLNKNNKLMNIDVVGCKSNCKISKKCKYYNDLKYLKFPVYHLSDLNIRNIRKKTNTCDIF
jgi:hypothetical protein